MRIPIRRKGGSLRRLLFLCADNHLASRYCEELFNSRIRGEGLNWQGLSRAFRFPAGPRPVEPMAPEAVSGLRRRGAAPVNHRRLPLAAVPFDFETSQQVVAVLGPTDRRQLLEIWPEQADRIEFWTVVPFPVSDCLDELTLAVDALVERCIDTEAGLPLAGDQRGEPANSAKLGRHHPTPMQSRPWQFTLEQPGESLASAESARPKF